MLLDFKERKNPFSKKYRQFPLFKVILKDFICASYTCFDLKYFVIKDMLH